MHFPKLLSPALLFASALFSLAAPAVPPIGLAPRPDTKAKLESVHPDFDRLITPATPIEIVAEGFNWSEGPVWWPSREVLLFSDVPENRVYEWSAQSGLKVFLEPSGFTGEKYEGREPGSNGLTLDREGRLVLCQHGDRRVARLNDDQRTFTTLADRFDGKRFSSPNDLCFNRRGQLFFTDPPYGLPHGVDPEQPFHGVYRRDLDGKVSLITSNLERPNGVALSVDERRLYIGNSHGPNPIILEVELNAEGQPVAERTFFDAKPLIARTGRGGAFDGLKVDTSGRVWATGPGGVLVLSPQGVHLGTILTGRATANCAFGGPDRSILYITSDEALLRVKTSVTGTAP